MEPTPLSPAASKGETTTLILSKDLLFFNRNLVRLAVLVLNRDGFLSADHCTAGVKVVIDPADCLDKSVGAGADQVVPDSLADVVAVA